MSFACVMLGNLKLVKDPVGLPPPVVLRLSEFGLPVVAVQVWPVFVVTAKSRSPNEAKDS